MTSLLLISLAIVLTAAMLLMNEVLVPVRFGYRKWQKLGRSVSFGDSGLIYSTSESAKLRCEMGSVGAPG